MALPRRGIVGILALVLVVATVSVYVWAEYVRNAHVPRGVWTVATSPPLQVHVQAVPGGTGRRCFPGGGIGGETQIPRTLVRTWSHSRVDPRMRRLCHDRWLDMNPGMPMRWFDDAECLDMLRSMMPAPWSAELVEAWRQLVPGAFRADLWRYCYLWLYGGVYVDSFAVPYASLDSILGPIFERSPSAFVSALDRKGIHNGFMACAPGHPFLRQAIDDVLAMVRERRYGDDVLAITGPVLLRRAVHRAVGLPADSPLNVGWNLDDRLYLLDHQPDVHQTVYQDGRPVLCKKYDVLLHGWRKWILRNATSYSSVWHQRRVYRDGRNGGP